MLRIDISKPKTALEIRGSAIEVCSSVANELGVYAKFHQSQQQALTGRPGERNRERVGDGRHKNWLMDFQTDPPKVSKPEVIGRVILRVPYEPEFGEYGGFYYGEYGQPKPVYRYITIHRPSDLGHWRPVDLSDEMLEMVHSGLKQELEGNRLFSITEYTK